MGGLILACGIAYILILYGISLVLANWIWHDLSVAGWILIIGVALTDIVLLICLRWFDRCD